MDVIRLLTSKLKQQTISEVSPCRRRLWEQWTEEGAQVHGECEASDPELEDIARGSLEHVRTVEFVRSAQDGGEAGGCRGEKRGRVNSSLGSGRGSSEDELACLCRTKTPEKRKWSQVTPSHTSNSPSCDEEVQDLTSHGDRLPSHFRVTPPALAVCPLPQHKRHKVVPRPSSRVSPATGEGRPRLNLEKMQKKAKRQCSSSWFRAKVVKVKSVRGECRSPRGSLCDPSVFAFRTICTSPCRPSPCAALTLTPVEEPICF